MVKRKYSKSGMRKPMSRSMKESYSDIDHSNVWDAYDVAMEYLGAEEFCEALAKAMGTDELESNLKYIFRVYEIPFMDDEEEFDESCSRKRLRKESKDFTSYDAYLSSVLSNYKVEQTDGGTWVVKADSDRFGKQAIVYEGSSQRECLNWMYKHIRQNPLDDYLKDEGCHRKSKKRRKSMKEAVDDDTVYVVFRKEKNPTEDDIFYGNDVTAFIYGNGIPVRYGNIMCYQHVGQHGEASLDYYNSTKPATPDEYADLLSELKSIYNDVNLVVRRKIDYSILRNEWRR